jgi:hypothetical protein
MPSWKADIGSHNMKFPAVAHSLPYSRSPSNGPDCAPDESNQLQTVHFNIVQFIVGIKSCILPWGFSLICYKYFSFPSWLLRVCCRYNYIQQVNYNFVLSIQIWKSRAKWISYKQMKRQFVCKKNRWIVLWLHLTAISQFYKFKKVKLVLIMDDKLGRM